MLPAAFVCSSPSMAQTAVFPSRPAATELERIFTGPGIPIRLSQTKMLKESLPFILDNSMKNFNADPKREFICEKDMLGAVLEANW